MISDSRIEVFRFNLVSNSAGNISSYTDYSLNGEIKSIKYKPTDFETTGSLFIRASGTNELIYTQLDNLDAVQVQYPKVYANDKNGATGSPFVFVDICVNSPLFLVGSGVGDSKTGVLEIYYG